RDAEILSPEALDFVAGLQRRFGGRREELLAARAARQERLLAGELPDFLPETREVRESDWRVAEAPPDLQDRRVEITGPTDRKMVIDALERTIALDQGEKSYRLKDEVATLLVRPRGWHLPERHLLVDGEPVSGS